MKALALAAAVLGVFLAGAAPAGEWVKREDPHGFEVELPPGWGARVLANGQVVFSPEPETLLGPQACVWNLHTKKSQKAADVARALVESYRAVLPDLTAEGPHQLKGKLADSCSMRGKLTVMGEEWRFVFVVSAQGKVATMTGFSAPAGDCRELKPVFARVLASFKLRKELRDEKRIAPPADQWVKWTDPKEGAFSLMVPKDWKVDGQSGLVRPYIDPSAWFSARRDGKDSTAITLLDPAPPTYIEPSQMLAMTGFREGAKYNPSGGVTQDMIVMRYPGAQGYIKGIYASQVKKAYPDAKLEEVLDRTDFVNLQPANPWMKIDHDGAEGRLSGTIGGVKVRGLVYVITARVVPPGMETGLWFAKTGSLCAPPEEFERTHDIFWRMKDSLRIDPRWAAREARAQVKRSQIMANAADDVAEMMHKSYETRSRAMDEISRKWSNATLGQTDLVDPETGDVHYGVPSGSNYYWKVGGDIVGTETHTRPAVDAVDLQNLADLRQD